jgi:hypothetical protein
MNSANALANAMSGLRVRRAPSGGANALANAMHGLAVGRSSAAVTESQRDRAFRKIVLEALLEVKRMGTRKNLEALGFKPQPYKVGPHPRAVAYYKKELKRAIFKVEFNVIPDEGFDYFFTVLTKRPNATKTKRYEILHVYGNGHHNRVEIDNGIGDAHDRAIARKAIQSVGWQTVG